MSFWNVLPKPFSVLAPMDDVTDVVFRTIVASVARPEVFFTEFVSVDGLCSPGKPRLIEKLRFSKSESPIVAQVWGLEPRNYYTIAQEIVRMGFDGIDINMGCPDRTVLKHGACIGLVNNRPLVRNIIQAVKEGVKGQIPISVKTRLGLKSVQTEDWIGFLLDQDLDALTVHGRTAKEMSKTPARWDEIAKVVHMRNAMKKQTVIIGNGDVKSWAEALDKSNQTVVDGIMIGRGIFSDIGVFDKTVPHKVLSLPEKIMVFRNHLNLFDTMWGDTRNYAILKKFFKIYINDFKNAGEFRDRLMQTKSVQEATVILEELSAVVHKQQI